MKGSWRGRIVFPTLLMTAIFMSIPTPALCEGPCDGPVVELKKSDRDALALLGEGVVGKPLPACPLYDTAGLMPFREGKWTYRITAGAHKGKRQEAVISKTEGTHSRNSAEHFWQRDLKGDCTEFYSIHGKGFINLLFEVNLTHSVTTRIIPPIFQSCLTA